MVGIELVTDKKDKTPAKAETAVLFEKLRGTHHIISEESKEKKKKLFDLEYFYNQNLRFINNPDSVNL